MLLRGDDSEQTGEDDLKEKSEATNGENRFVQKRVFVFRVPNFYNCFPTIIREILFLGDDASENRSRFFFFVNRDMTGVAVWINDRCRANPFVVWVGEKDVEASKNEKANGNTNESVCVSQSARRVVSFDVWHAFFEGASISGAKTVLSESLPLRVEQKGGRVFRQIQVVLAEAHNARSRR